MLLRPADPRYWCPVDALPDVHGSYLYWDTIQCKWVRSGKVVGRGVAERVAEHEENSKQRTTSTKKSRFYSTYPATPTSADGAQFADLACYVGIAWDASNATACAALCGSDLLSWTATTMAMITRSKVSSSKPQKQLAAVGFLCELVLELCLGVDDIVSESPGFEAFTGFTG